MGFRNFDVKNVKLPKDVSKNVHKNAPLYAGGILFMVIVKLAFVAGGLFVVAVQQAKILADTKTRQQLEQEAKKPARKAKKTVKKTADKVKKAAESA